jgi:hypothetical protein
LFCDELDSEIAGLINFGSRSGDGQNHEFARRIGIAIDEHTIPVIASLRTNAAEQQAINDGKAAVLKSIQSDLEVLRGSIRSGGDAVIQELEHKRDRDLANQEREVVLAKGRARKLQQQTLHRVELEKQIARQKSEATSLFHALKGLESKRRTFHEDILPAYRTRSPESENILREINDLQEKMGEDPHDEVISALEDALKTLDLDREGMTQDTQRTELATRRLLAFLEAMALHPGRPARDGSPRRAPFSDRVHPKADELQRTRRKKRTGDL